MMTVYSLKDELTHRDNLAIALSSVGYLSGIAIICLSAAAGESKNYITGVIDIAVFSLLGMILLLISKLINDKFILSKFSIRKELVNDKNAGTGAVMLGSYLASAVEFTP